jgi:hypothetical protein
MKVTKKTIFSKSNLQGDVAQVSSVSKQSKVIKLKEITEADRQKLRIPSYQYLLP